MGGGGRFTIRPFKVWGCPAWVLNDIRLCALFRPMMAAGASRQSAIIVLNRAHNRMSLSQNFIKNKHNWVWIWMGVGHEWWLVMDDAWVWHVNDI